MQENVEIHKLLSVIYMLLIIINCIYMYNLHELQHRKTNNVVFVQIKDSDQPVYKECLNQSLCVPMKKFKLSYMSRVVRKPAFCICENKDADQLRGNHEADQRLCFRFTDSTISLLPKYEISSLQPSSVAVQPGLCGTWSETPKTGFLTTRLISIQ